MTDITELAQRLKAAAEKATPGHWEYYPGNTSIEYNVDSMDEDHGSIVYVDSGDFTQAQTDRNGEFIALANPANVLALVEALEKAQQRNGELETYSKTALEFREAARDENRHLKLELEIAEKRIAGLEESHAQVIQSRDHYKRMSEEGLKLLAESRTVTVKLPTELELRNGEVCSECAGNALQMVEDKLSADGIKWEVEPRTVTVTVPYSSEAELVADRCNRHRAAKLRSGNATSEAAGIKWEAE
ncbi:TPA: ead/Ea22-like family protein [Klebsiella aerogenes]